MDGTTRTVSVRIIDQETAARIVDDMVVSVVRGCADVEHVGWQHARVANACEDAIGGTILSTWTLKSVVLSTLLPADVRPKEELAASLTAGESVVAATAVELIVAAAASQAVGAGAAV
jgi:hypothetical protein